MKFLEGRLVSLQRNEQLHGGPTQLTDGSGPGGQPVRGVHQYVIDRLFLCKQNTKSCELDEGRQTALERL